MRRPRRRIRSERVRRFSHRDSKKREAENTESLTGWTVESGDVDIVRGPFTFGGSKPPGIITPLVAGWPTFPANATHFLDLCGSEPGTISQTFDTEAGADYVLSFSLAANPTVTRLECGSVTVALATSAGTPLTEETIAAFAYGRGPRGTNTTGGTSYTANAWRTQEIAFTALTASTKVTFSTCAGANDEESAGVCLDDVSVTAE